MEDTENIGGLPAKVSKVKKKTEDKNQPFASPASTKRLMIEGDKLELIRIDYLAGAYTNADIAKRNNITITQLYNLAKEYNWRDQVLSPEDRVKVKEYVVDGKCSAYIGPLTTEEKVALAANTLENAQELIKTHKRVISKAMVLAERTLDEMIKNDGKIETIKFIKGRAARGKEEAVPDREIKLMVDGTERLVQLTKVLQACVPLDRVTHGIDDYYKPSNSDAAEDKERTEQLRRAIIDGMNKMVTDYREAKRIQEEQVSIVDARARLIDEE